MQRLGRFAPRGREVASVIRAPSLRANGSRECAPDDRLREATQTPSFRDGPQDQTSDAQLRIGESRDSGFDAEPVIGPRFARTRWHRPGMTALLFENLNPSLVATRSVCSLPPQPGFTPVAHFNLAQAG
jgi:hypothetical protein